MRTMSMTAEHRETYEREGYLVLPGVFDAGEIARMRAESDRLVTEAVNASIALGRRSPRLDLQRRDGVAVVRKLQPIVDASDVFAATVRDERLVGPLRDLLGCEPVLMEEKLNVKQVLPTDVDVDASEDGEGFLLHTDWAYFRAQGYPIETLSSAVSIDASTPDNGPIRVLPGSHRHTYPEREGYPPVLADGAVNEDTLVDVLAPPGSVMVFHSALVHSSSQNRSGRPRRIMIFSHYPSTHDGDADRRNRPLRERAQAHENEYRALLADGYQPSFSL